jgi:hypothetical protein
MFSRLRTGLIVAWALLALVAGTLVANAGDEPTRPADKARLAPLDDRYAKIVAGVGKMKEAEVIALLGPAHTMKRPVAKELGQPEADVANEIQLDALWELAEIPNDQAAHPWIEMEFSGGTGG